ncbi:MAG TPA: DUF5658 family protein [Acidimicrobiales bacterium]|nr:DUF5658 family protein [Acidimicrobiales bacterium]
MTSPTPTAVGLPAPAATLRPARAAGRYQLLGGLQVADVATTWVILANFSSKAEGNPVVATMIHHAGLQVAMVALLVVKLAVVYVLYEKQTGVNVMSAIYGLVVFNNLLALGLALGS